MSEYPSYQQNLSTSSTREEVILAIQNLSFAYALAPNSKVIEDFSCKVYAGQISLLLGPTGSGKSTILSLIKPEIAPQGKQDGSIIVCGQEVSTMTQAQSVDTIAFVPQAASRARVGETPLKELAFGLENRGVSEKEMRRRIFETVSFFGMEPLLHKRNCELSGGEQQLVALAAALVMRPKLLLLDEPTSQLDPFAQKNFTALLERVARELNVAVLVRAPRRCSHLPRRRETRCTPSRQLFSPGALSWQLRVQPSIHRGRQLSRARVQRRDVCVSSERATGAQQVLT